MSRVDIDLVRSAARIDEDVQTLASPPYTQFPDRVCRYAYTDAYRRTLEYFASAWRALRFTVEEDPVGNFIACNRPYGQPVFGVGSHCDSNRNGGRWDGAMGVAIALELSRLNAELGLELPLRAISFLEEEGSGFGQLLLGSAIVTQQLDERDLRERVRAIDDGRSFWEHAADAGHHPDQWRESARILDDLSCWIEVHIEQGRILQDAGRRIGIVQTIAGYVHGDVTISGRADHAGATPMTARMDSAVVAGMALVELERLAVEAGAGTVGTVGEVQVEPGAINVIPGQTRISLDVRGPNDAAVDDVVRELVSFTGEAAQRRGMRVDYAQRRRSKAAAMDPTLVAALEQAAAALGQQPLRMVSGAAHDTMLVAERVPSAMIFVPCRDGLSHTPLEHADALDAALATQVILGALVDANE